MTPTDETRPLPPELEELVRELAMGQLDFVAFGRLLLRESGVGELVEAAEALLRLLDAHAPASYGDPEDALRTALARYRKGGE